MESPPRVSCHRAGYLAAEVTDVSPLPVAVLTAADVGAKFLGIGYGIQEARALMDTSAVPPRAGTRRAGTLTLGAVSGRYWELRYGSFEAFAAASKKSAEAFGQPWDEQSARKQYDSDTLLEGYDAQMKGAAGDAAVCNGDSGGPLLKWVGGKWTIYGVVSGMKFIPQDESEAPCLVPSIYASFGPEALHLVRASLSCGGVTQRGRCDADVASRCTWAHEGPARVVSNDCAAMGLTCSSTAAEPLCLPGCQSDADCASYAPFGVCRGATSSQGGQVSAGRCEWARQCGDEPGAFACYLCCMGKAMGADGPDMAALGLCSIPCLARMAAEPAVLRAGTSELRPARR